MGSGKLRVGIAGKRGLAYVEGIRSVPDVEVTAFCDLDEAVLRAEADRLVIDRRLGRFEDLLGEVDVAVIATPQHLHAGQSIQALDAGVHVLSEVTAAVTLEECWRIRDAIERSRARWMMAENYCFFPDNLIVGEMVRQGLFGEPYFAVGEYMHELRWLFRTPEGKPTWRYYWHVGINGNTYPTHNLGPIMHWFAAAGEADRIESVVCLGSGRHTDPGFIQDDTTVTLCRLASGKLVQLRQDVLSNRPTLGGSYQLQGTRGVFETARELGGDAVVWVGEHRDGDDRRWQPLRNYAHLMPATYHDPSPAARQAPHLFGDYFLGRHFALSLVRDEPFPVDSLESLEWTAVGLCSQISIQNHGAAIQVPDFRDTRQRPGILDAPPAACDVGAAISDLNK